MLTLRLPVRLRVERGTQQESGPQNPMQSLPKIRSETGVPVGHNRCRHPIMPNDVLEKEPRHFPPRQTRFPKCAGDKPTQFGQSIDNRQHGIMAGTTHRHGSDKVHRPRLKSASRYRQRC